MAYTNTTKILLTETQINVSTMQPNPPYNGVRIQHQVVDRIKSGSRVDSWAEKLRTRQDASSSYSLVSYRSQTTNPGYCIRTMKTGADAGKYESITTYPRPLVYSPIPFSGTYCDRNLAIRRFYDRVREYYTTWSSLISLGEAKELKGLINHNARRLFTGFLGARRELKSIARSTVRGGVRRTQRNLSSAWLELQFGLLPTIADMEDAQKAWSDLQYRVSDRISGSSKYTDRYTDYTWRGNGGAWLKQIETRTDTDTVKFTTRLRIPPTIPSSFGLSLREIPGVVWELTPWSFLVDYFVDIGGWLQSVSYGSVKFLYVCESVKKTRQIDIRLVPFIENTPTYFTYGEHGSAQYSSVRYSRSPMSTLPVYDPLVRIAGAFQGLREFNILALLGSRIDIRVKR